MPALYRPQGNDKGSSHGSHPPELQPRGERLKRTNKCQVAVRKIYSRESECCTDHDRHSLQSRGTRAC